MDRRRATDPIESTVRKLKNSGYAIIGMFFIQIGITWQGNRDFTDSQKVINARQQLTNEQQFTLNSKYDSMLSELKAIVAGQDRRLTILEGRK